MPWTADLIYTKPTPDLMKRLGGMEGFTDELFLVNDLDGIKSEWARAFMLSEQQTDSSYMKHALPASGLLAIKPPIRLGFGEAFKDAFWDTYRDYPADKWGFLASSDYEQLEVGLDLKESQLKLLGFLRSLSREFETPIMYYYCFMWGGLTEEEYAIVFDDGIRVYAFDRETKKDVEIKGEQKEALTFTVLQASLKHLDLELPTWFFALHESSFDWKRYHLKKAAL